MLPWRCQVGCVATPEPSFFGGSIFLTVTVETTMTCIALILKKVSKFEDNMEAKVLPC